MKSETFRIQQYSDKNYTDQIHIQNMRPWIMQLSPATYKLIDNILTSADSKVYTYEEDSKSSFPRPSVAVVRKWGDRIQMVAVSVAFGLYATDTVVYPIDQKKIRLDKNFNLSACLYNVYRCDDFLTDMKSKQRDTRALYSCTGDGNKGAVIAHEQVHGKNFVKQFVLRWKKVTETHHIVFLELGSKKDTFK